MKIEINEKQIQEIDEITEETGLTREQVIYQMIRLVLNYHQEKRVEER